MREILFRGKRADDGKWVCGHYVHQYGADMIYLPNGVDREYGFDYYHINSETIGQYTGLTDKNGTKIFEGDILKTKCGIYVCFWDDCNFEFGIKNNQESFGIAYMPLKDLRVISNIHDNPELLKE